MYPFVNIYALSAPTNPSLISNVELFYNLNLVRIPAEFIPAEAGAVMTSLYAKRVTGNLSVASSVLLLHQILVS